ncbi:MAG TPA: diaminopropionate ammonia-lyase, partial [Rubrobacter sp.]|nr:diaminopropionate ammonia-lyase [Rubrobacter sp.]
MSIRTLINPNAREMIVGPGPDRAPLRFHRRLPGYEETPLLDAPKLADALGVAKVFVKDESDRLGLPAFKVLGASWAVYRTLQVRLGEEVG